MRIAVAYQMQARYFWVLSLNMCPLFCYCSCSCDLFPHVCPLHVVANPLCLGYFVCVSNISVFVLLLLGPISLYLIYFMRGQFLHICPTLCEASFSDFLCGQFFYNCPNLCAANFFIFILLFVWPISTYWSYFCAVNFFIFVLCVANISIFCAICVWSILHVVPLHAVTYRASCPTTQCMVLYY